MSSGRVAVLGGGVGGLSVAHELADRGLDVAVYERNGRFGGKARSMPAITDDDAPTLPGEHGFRFFPGFYRHLTETMAEIPYGDGTVEDNLVPTSRMLQLSRDDPPTSMTTATPDSASAWREFLGSVFARERVPPTESRFFAERLLVFLTSSEQRRREEYDRTSWWEFIGAESRSPAYRRYLADGVTQALVAMRPQQSSARTVGRIYVQLVLGLLDPSVEADRVLNGPTNDVWIDPWVEHLRSLGVEFHPNAPVERIEADGDRVTGVALADGRIEADQYVAALPLEVVTHLLEREPALERAVPSLSGVRRLDTAWMAGAQFYLTEDVEISPGHAVYYDSPWALTTISQRQFWSEFDLSAHPEVEGVLSVCISDWDTPGDLYGKPARECTREEVLEEVWAQLRAHLNRDGPVLEDAIRYDAFLDPAIVETDDGLANESPLLINTVGSLAHRPPAATAADNLALAADYVHTNTDLASMEAANEAARRAANAILDRLDVDAPRAPVYDLEEPGFFRPFKLQDRARYRLGLPHPGEVTRSLRRRARSVLPG